jgi:hypothetical protein
MRNASGTHLAFYVKLGLAAVLLELVYSLWLAVIAAQLHQPLLFAVRCMVSVLAFCVTALLVIPPVNQKMARAQKPNIWSNEKPPLPSSVP